MKSVRTAARALIIDDDKVLTIKMKGPLGEYFYVLPGGGQQHGESLEEGLQRECLEEIGLQVTIGDVVYCRDYIGKNHKFHKAHKDFHQLEIVFSCKVDKDLVKDAGHSPDNRQVGILWIPISELSEYELYPIAMRDALCSGQFNKLPCYLGDVN